MGKKVKIWLIIATCLLLAGAIVFAGVMTALNWDFIKLSTIEYERNKYTIDESFNNISITTDTADVTVVPTEDTKASIVCYERAEAKHSVKVIENSLKIKIEDKSKWYKNIGINFESAKITVYVPISEYGTLDIKSDTGDVELKKCNARSMKIKTETGDVQLEKCEAEDIFIKTDTGDVEGSLLSDKVFITKTDTGDINVPKTITGGRCEITTDTGDIKIKIEK